MGHAIIIAGFAIGTIIGFWKQSLLIAIYGWAAGLVLAILVEPKEIRFSLLILHFFSSYAYLLGLGIVAIQLSGRRKQIPTPRQNKPKRFHHK